MGLILKLEKYSKPWIIQKAGSNSGLFVHKYKYGHEKLRQKARRLCKDGKLELVKQTKDGFYYKVLEQ